MKFKHIGVVTLALSVLYGCHDDLQQLKFDASQMQVFENQKYGPDELHDIDIALPAGRDSSTPFVIFIHGGAWQFGEKVNYKDEIRMFAEAGIAAASINYRLASRLYVVHHPAQPNDVERAIDFVKSQSTIWQVSPNRIGLCGFSSGGHLAMLVAYAFNNDNAVKAIASWAGVSDFVAPEQLAIDGMPGYIGTYLGEDLITPEDTAKWKAASPFWVVTAQAPPTLLIHGDNDDTVPFSTGVALKNKLDSLGVPNQLITLDASHLLSGAPLDQARLATLDWFHVKL